MNKQKGMTLVELMATIAISGALAAIAIPKLTGMTLKAKKVELYIVTDTFFKAMDAYTITQGHYPPTLADAGFALPNSSFFSYTAEGEEEDKDNNGNGGSKEHSHKQTVCHGSHSITVANPAIYNAHLEHGDNAGECEGETISLIISPEFNVSDGCPANTPFNALWNLQDGGILSDVDGDCVSQF